jgi:predicted molibdopterin-dependent oxidoreductase YjgC
LAGQTSILTTGGAVSELSSEGQLQMAGVSRNRLTQPLIRENGSHRPATWDEALDRVAQGFRTEIQKHGPRTFGMFSCSKTTNELNYISQKFVRTVIGCNNIDSCNRT